MTKIEADFWLGTIGLGLVALLILCITVCSFYYIKNNCGR